MIGFHEKSSFSYKNIIIIIFLLKKRRNLILNGNKPKNNGVFLHCMKKTHQMNFR